MRSLRVKLVRLVGILTALAVLSTGTAFARAHFFCRMMNRVVATCCCEGEAASVRAARCSPTVRVTDCCERLSPTARTPALKAAGAEVFVAPAAIAFTVPALQYALGAVVTVRTLPAQARAPPSVGPPLFIANCSLLT